MKNRVFFACLILLPALILLSCSLLSSFDPRKPINDRESATQQNTMDEIPTPSNQSTATQLIPVDQNLKIAFIGTGWAVPGAGPEIFLMHADGTGIVPVSLHRGSDNEAAWSPDGKQILFSTNRDGNYEIYIMDVDGQNQRRLTNDQASDHDPSMSKDGRIVFCSDRDGTYDIFIMNETGEEVSKLFERTSSDRYPVWSPDGTQIAFSSFGGTEDSGIYIMDIEGILLAHVSGAFHNPAWSPDGMFLAMDGEPAGCKFEVYIMNADGTDVHAVTSNPAGCGSYNKHPSWSPDGEWLVYSSQNDNNETNIFKIKVDGTQETQLTDFNAMPGILGKPHDPVWSPVP
jgi:TolB protein